MGSEHDSRLKGREFESCQILDGNDVKVMPGLIPVTQNPGSYSQEKERNIGSQMGHTKKNIQPILNRWTN